MHRNLTAESRDEILEVLEIYDEEELKEIYQPTRRRQPCEIVPMWVDLHESARKSALKLGPKMQSSGQEFPRLFAVALYIAQTITHDASLEVNLELIGREYLRLQEHIHPELRARKRVRTRTDRKTSPLSPIFDPPSQPPAAADGIPFPPVAVEEETGLPTAHDSNAFSSSSAEWTSES